MVKEYLEEIYRIYSTGEAREESFYPALRELLLKYAEKSGRSGVEIVMLPKQSDVGCPDFKLLNGNSRQIGYIEAKRPEIGDLDKIEASEQLERYLQTFPNLILTNFFEFRFYRDHKLVQKVSIANPFVMTKLETLPPVENEKLFFELLDKYFSYSIPKISNAETLAAELAKRTRFLKDQVIIEELKQNHLAENQIAGFYEAFRKYLIHDLKAVEFADLYSQTVTYGLFAARTKSTVDFNRKSAFDAIPKTIGVLRDIFRFISLGDLPKPMEIIVDDISDLLAATNVNDILHQYYAEGKGEDPIVHFYETFLSVYDPALRERRGVYYTPEPVVKYIVNSIHSILREKFNLSDGLADKNVTILDPSAGTMTFIAQSIKTAVNEFISKYGNGVKVDFIKNHVLNNYYAFELMMAPYAVGHLKISFLLEEIGYKFSDDERFKLFLTNSLELETFEQSALPGMSSLSNESRKAGYIKKEQPILVIIGNPPYSVSSANKSVFIQKAMETYKEDVRDEKNIQPLSDDYIKFIRFAHWKIEQAGKGCIGMITNNSYLSGLIHRGMRKKLLETFDEIYIVNLHGNSRIKENCPDGSKDENVFEIKQGVSILLLIKNSLTKNTKTIKYYDLYGLRESKYEYLMKNSINSTEWLDIKPTEPSFFWIQKDYSLWEQYSSFFSIKNIFVNYNVGTTTGKDDILVGIGRNELKSKFSLFDNDSYTAFMEINGVGKKKAQEWFQEMQKTDFEKQIIDFSYRPFDDRYIIYNSKMLERSRNKFMIHMSSPNIALVVQKTTVRNQFSEVFVSQKVTDYHLIGHQSYIFPLYIYGNQNNYSMSFRSEEDDRIVNIYKSLIKKLRNKIEYKLNPNNIFNYIYAVLYSNVYRNIYLDFLKTDFPRIPFTDIVELFMKISTIGEELIELHLLKSVKLNNPLVKFLGTGNCKVEKIKYENETIYINKDQYIKNIDNILWQYQIGGYQVLKSWLNYRKGRILSFEEIQHFCKTATALHYTMELQKQIDEIYPEIEKSLIDFKS